MSIIENTLALQECYIYLILIVTLMEMKMQAT